MVMHDEPHPQAIILTLLAAGLSAAAGALSDGLTLAEAALHGMTVMDDARLRLVCIMGAIGGALIIFLFGTLLFIASLGPARPF